MGSTNIQIIEAKTGLSKGILSEPFLVSLYRAMAPYRGCGHGCAYCDGRSEKYYVEGDFERDICVRKNLSSLVTSDISKGIALREYGAVCMGSGVADIYQPLERKLLLTRQTLEALIPSQLPIVILTKSDLILRDFDLLKRFPKVLVIMTVTTVDPSISRIIESAASLPSKRLEVVKKAKEAGFFSGIMAMPLCPGISDTDEQTTALFASATEAGADFIYPGGLTLRPGRQKDLFLSVVAEHFPSLKGQYERIYRENRPSGMPDFDYSSPVMSKWNTRLEKEGMSQMIPHRIYRELLSPPDSLYVLLNHMQSLYAYKGIDTRPLRSATERYTLWLKENRTGLRRKRSSTAPSDPFPLTRILTERLAEICKTTGGFEKICANAKLSSLVEAIINENTYFDYSTLTLKR